MRTWARRWSCPANSRSRSRARVRPSRPTPPTSFSSRSNPLEVPSPLISGGAVTLVAASRIFRAAWLARLAVMAADCDAAVRSFQSRSSTKDMPVFWPLPLKLRPAMENTALTEPVSARNAASSCSWASTVRCSVAPEGSCMMASSEPWSSSGRNAVGSATNSSANRPNSAKNTSMARRVCGSSLRTVFW